MRRGAVLVLVLLLIACLFILSAGFLARKGSEGKVAQLVRLGAQSREMAYAGLESVRVRLLNDANFPPSVLNANQDYFSFTEGVLDFDGASEIGRYQVHCDRRWVQAPYCVLRVISVGEVGGANNPVRHKLTCEFKMAPDARGDLVNLLDEGQF
jgi:hypothetical protein